MAKEVSSYGSVSFRPNSKKNNNKMISLPRSYRSEWINDIIGKEIDKQKEYPLIAKELIIQKKLAGKVMERCERQLQEMIKESLISEKEIEDLKLESAKEIQKKAYIEEAEIIAQRVQDISS